MVNPSINKTAVVVLNWNGTDDTISCLASLVHQTYAGFDIILVDNGSAPESVARLDHFVTEYPLPLTYLKNDRNLGFAGGVNTGIRHALTAGYETVALLNNDAVADKEWLAGLTRELSRSDVSIVTGTLFHKDGRTIDSTGELYSRWGLPFPRSRNESATVLPQAGYVFGATGGATLYRTSLFTTVGLFDERFFAYYEDVDLSFRAQLAGHRVYYTPNAVAYHEQGASSRRIPGFTVYQMFKNLPLLYWKNIPAGLMGTVGVRLASAYILMLGNALTHGTGGAALKGVGQSLILLPYAIRARRRIQSSASASTHYIRSILYPDLPPNQVRLRRLREFFTRQP